MLPLEVQPGQCDGLDDVVERVRQQLRVHLADGAAHNFDVDRRGKSEVGGDDDGT